MFSPAPDVTIERFTDHVRDSANVKCLGRGAALRPLDLTPCSLQRSRPPDTASRRVRQLVVVVTWSFDRTIHSGC